MKCRNDTEGEREKEMSDDLSLVSEISEEIEERDATRPVARGGGGKRNTKVDIIKRRRRWLRRNGSRPGVRGKWRR